MMCSFASDVNAIILFNKYLKKKKSVIILIIQIVNDLKKIW